MFQINGESEDQTCRRERQVLDNFRTEKDLLKLQAESHEERYRQIDEEMLSVFSEKATGRTKDKLLELWRNDTKKEEDISVRRWDNKNKVWLQKYVTEFCRQYMGKNPFIKQGQIRFETQSTEDRQVKNSEPTQINAQRNYYSRRRFEEDRNTGSTYANVVWRNTAQGNRQPNNQRWTNRNISTTFIGQQTNRRRERRPYDTSRIRNTGNGNTENHSYGQTNDRRPT